MFGKCGGHAGQHQPQSVQIGQIRRRLGGHAIIFLLFRRRLTAGRGHAGGYQSQSGGGSRQVQSLFLADDDLPRHRAQGLHLRPQRVHIHVVQIADFFFGGLLQALVAGDQFRREAGDLLPLLVGGRSLIELDQGLVAAAVHQIPLGRVGQVLLFLFADGAETADTGQDDRQADG